MASNLARKRARATDAAEQVLAGALRLHRKGDLAAAASLYERVLRSKPRHFGALHLLAVARQQQHDSAEALRLVEAALRVMPQSPDALSTRGVALNSLGRRDEALASYDAAVALDPGHVDALINRARLLLALGRAAEALKSSDQALTRDPCNRTALTARGNALFELKRGEEALASFEQALTLAPDDIDALYNVALALQGLKRPDTALQKYNELLARRSDHADALYNRGRTLLMLERAEEALTDLDLALALRPDHVDAIYYRGLALGALERCAAALEEFDRALALAPQRADIHAVRGATLLVLKHYEEALAALDHALASDPDNAVTLNNRGRALILLKRYDEALATYDRVLALKPDYAEAFNNRGFALADLGRYDEALVHYAEALRLAPRLVQAHVRRGDALLKLAKPTEALLSFAEALAIEPNNPDANFDAAIARLCLGDFREGWKQYEYRWSKTNDPVEREDYPRPIWDGSQDLNGKTILLTAEQGMGDAIQFVRYAPLVAARGAKVLLGVHGPLTTLMATVPGITKVMTQGDVLPHFDFYCPLMSVPLAFGTELATIPASVPYIRPHQERIAQWQHRMPAQGRLRVGICWAGTALHLNNHRRSIPLERFARIFVSGIDFVSLQKDVTAVDAALLREQGVVPLGQDFTDFADTAAVVAMLDLVIAVDTSVAHLAGAMAKATAVLIPFAPDFRWMLDRTDSPWYPTMRLFRQTVIDDWSGPLDRLRRELEVLAAKRR